MILLPEWLSEYSVGRLAGSGRATFLLRFALYHVPYHVTVIAINMCVTTGGATFPTTLQCKFHTLKVFLRSVSI